MHAKLKIDVVHPLTPRKIHMLRVQKAGWGHQKAGLMPVIFMEAKIRRHRG